jgi:hypothetical protein
MHTDTEDGFQDNEQEVREQLTLNEVPEGIQTESSLAAPVEEEKPHDAKKKFIQELGSELLHLAKIAIVSFIGPLTNTAVVYHIYCIFHHGFC